MYIVYCVHMYTRTHNTTAMAFTLLCIRFYKSISGAACGPLITGWVSDEFVSCTCMSILHDFSEIGYLIMSFTCIQFSILYVKAHASPCSKMLNHFISAVSQLPQLQAMS
jgi:hypothetical protein